MLDRSSENAIYYDYSQILSAKEKIDGLKSSLNVAVDEYDASKNDCKRLSLATTQKPIVLSVKSQE